MVMRCLEKERAVAATSPPAPLARDIERFLNHEPVEARPPSALYRVRKFVRRHRLAVVAGSFVLLSLIGGIIGTTLGMLNAYEQERLALKMSDEKEKQRKRAEQEKQIAEAVERSFTPSC